MATLCVSSSATSPIAIRNTTKKLQQDCIRAQISRLHHFNQITTLPRFSNFNPLRVSVNENGMMMSKNKGGGIGAVCYAGPISARNLQWISTISSAVLMLARGTAIHKSFLVPFLALQAPSSVISGMKGDYGIWTAFVALLVRLFFIIPGELELPFVALLLVIVAPYQVMNLRGTQEGSIIALVISGYLAFQHFSRAGSMQRAFEQGSIVASLAIICITVISCLVLI